jgi:hypothetical protein
MKKTNISDYDSGWKEAIEKYFEEFILFFFPHAHKDIDFTKPVEFLDKEFNKIVKYGKAKKRYSDSLVKVFLKNGTEQWILTHIEVHGYKESRFEKRLYQYNYRIDDRHDREVITLVILTDEDAKYRPESYEVNRWGFELKFKFPLIKLIDYKDKINLERAVNPFEIMTFAHLKNLETKKDRDQRLFWKITLVKLLYEKGYERKDILNLYRFIDWVMGLPDDLAEKFTDEIHKYEEEKKMRFVTSAERVGIKKGIEKGRKYELIEAIEDIIDIKFGEKGIFLMNRIKGIEDIEKLRAIKGFIKKSSDIEEITEVLDK